MELQTLKARTREKSGKGAAGRLRLSGVIPGVLYGEGQEPLSVETDAKIFTKLVHGRGGEHAIVRLEIEDRPELSSPALVKSLQHHPLRGSITHADFQRISLDKRIRTMVSIVLKGQPKGVIDGGILDHSLREIEVECLALQVPEFIEVNVADMGMGAIIHVEQIVAPENVEIVTESDRTVATVHPPRTVKEAEPVADAAAVAPVAGAPAAAGKEAAPAKGAAPAAKGAAPAAKAPAKGK